MRAKYFALSWQIRKPKKGLFIFWYFELDESTGFPFLATFTPEFPPWLDEDAYDKNGGFGYALLHNATLTHYYIIL